MAKAITPPRGESTTTVMMLKLPIWQLLVPINHNPFRTMASEMVDLIDWSLPRSISRAVPLKLRLHSTNCWSSCRESNPQASAYVVTALPMRSLRICVENLTIAGFSLPYRKELFIKVSRVQEWEPVRQRADLPHELVVHRQLSALTRLHVRKYHVYARHKHANG